MLNKIDIHDCGENIHVLISGQSFVILTFPVVSSDANSSVSCPPLSDFSMTAETGQVEFPFWHFDVILELPGGKVHTRG